MWVCPSKQFMAKPNVAVAMRDLITQIKTTLPFDGVESDFCSDTCSGCSLKLLDFLALEIEQWEERLDQGEAPSLSDVHKLGKTAKKIHTVLVKNQLI